MKKRATALLTLSILASLAVPSYAAEPANTDEAVRTPDVVVTATRTEEEVKAVPNTVEVITQEDIQKLGATDVYSALSLASNVNLRKAGMVGHNVMIRGMDTNHTLILIDGKRAAGEDTSETQNVYALDRMSISNIDRIEIVRGPASVMYGSDAMGGVINIITKKSEKPSTTVGVSTGTDSVNNYYHFDFGKNGNFSGTFDARFSKIRKNVGEGSSNSNFYGPVQDFNFAGNWDLGNNKNLDLTLGYYNEHTKADYENTKTSSGMFWTNKDKKEWYDFRRFDYSLGYSGTTDNSNYMIRTYYSRLNKENNLYNNRPGFPGPMENILGKLYPKYDWDKSTYILWGIEGRDSIQINDNHLLTAGFDYNKNSVEGTRMGGDNTHDVTQSGNGSSVTKHYGEKDIDTWAVYVQDEWMPNEKWLVIPAVRYDNHSEFGGEFTPKIGATYFINDNSRIKANVGKGFKAPTVSELYMYMHRAMGVATVDVYGNPDLKPEETTSWDLSYEAEFGKDNNSWTKLTYFYNDVKNLIDTEDITTEEESNLGLSKNRYINVDRAKIKGIEFELGHKLSDKWTAKLVNNWLDAEDGDGVRLNNRAKNTTSLQLSYDDNDPYGYSAVLWSDWNNKYRYTTSTTGSRDYTYNTTNFVINKKLGEGSRIYAGVDNIFDKKISTINLDGRIWRAGAEWTF